MKTILPTSTAGSLPKPSWLAEPEALWSPWKLEGEALAQGQKDALCVLLNEQQQAGIDIVSDGEQTRQHFVTTFIEHLNGVDFENRKTVKIRDRYEASVPSVIGPVSRQKPVFIEHARFLRQQTDQPIKWALPGPMTMIDTLYDAHYESREKLAWEFAKILNQEAKDLVEAGVDIFHCSTRRYWEPEFDGSDLNLAGWTKKITGLPTITVGSVGLSKDMMSSFKGEDSGTRSIDDLGDKLASEEFDLVAVGRALIQDPEWPNKVREGRMDELQDYSPKKLAELV